jgi:CheY-like chemotaxis protein
MLSEIRNKETADMAARTALTDHLVLSSVSASDSISAITTLLDLGIEPFLLSSSITGILAQRLIRKICPSCRTQTNLPKEFARDYFPDLKQCFKGSGCNECLFTGYRGLVGIYEFLPMTSKLKKAIVNNASEEELWEIARREGMVTLFENAWARIKDGVTTPDEVVSKVPFGRMKEKETAEEKEKTKVLLFNINDDDADVIRKALTTQDYEVVNVSGEDILEAAAKENPDCLFIDASKKTAELLRNLRKEIRYTYLSIFAVAKSIETEIEKEMMKLGIRGFLYSPMEPETVLNVFGFSSDTVQTRI